MLTIRLARIGKKSQPSFRVIVSEKSKDTRGDYLENLGFYNPRTKEIKLKVERIKYWLSKGAQTSDTVWNLLVNQQIVAGPKRKIKIRKKKKEEETSQTQTVSETTKE
jgi:small subunit ribosomal protein S16